MEMEIDDQISERTPPIRKKRNLPGMPDPDAEVIALSPKTLMAKNRFVCEICSKGFQRDQNLQLHRRGHNLPWKLRQRTGTEVKKRVFVCPEQSCVHHDPSRALGDLTGIKKHFCRKHGEKKYDCERCSKRYAVQSDWKAHMKTCGTKEYRCACGTLFSRRDSFITHRAFCDALAQETVRAQPLLVTGGDGDLKVHTVAPVDSRPPTPPTTPSGGVPSPGMSIQSSAELPENQIFHLPPPQPSPTIAPLSTSTDPESDAFLLPPPTTITANTSSTSSGHIFSDNSGFFTNTYSASTSSILGGMIGAEHPAIDTVSLSLSPSIYGGAPSVFSQNPMHYPNASRPPPSLSATALLQKAAQMGHYSTYQGVDNPPNPVGKISTPSSLQRLHDWDSDVNLRGSSMAFDEYMASPLGMFGDKPATLDFLGLGLISGGEASAAPASRGRFSAFLSSMDGGLNMATAGFGGLSPTNPTCDDSSDQKPGM